MLTARVRIAATVILLVSVVLLSPRTGGAARHDQAQVNVSTLLQGAKDEYKKDQLDVAEKYCDQIVTLLRSLAALDPDQRRQLATAYEVRARVRFGKDKPDLEGARGDFASLLAVDPSHQLGVETLDLGGVNPTVKSLFSSIKGETVGTLKLFVTPPNAEVRIDDSLVDLRTQPIEIDLVAGSHKISGKRAGYREKADPFSVTAGSVTDLSLALDRLTSTFVIITAPEGVEVLVDGLKRGTTPVGPPPASYDQQETVRSLVASSEAISGALEIPDITSGQRDIEFRKDCYVSDPRRMTVDRAGDYLIALKLVRAYASVKIDGDGGTVFVDGVSRGTVPLTLDICAGQRVVEVRTDRGRSVHRLDLAVGDQPVIRSEPRPAVAIVAATGVAEGSREDLRIVVEKALREATSLTMFAPPFGPTQTELQGMQLQPGWLAFDMSNRPIATYQAGTIPPAARRDLSSTLSKKLDVQGLAEITVPSKLEPRSVLLTLLAAGSGNPDVIPLDLDNPESIKRAVAKLSAPPLLFELSAGVQVADVHDIAGAVVVSQLWVVEGKPYLKDGDVIVAADGRAIQNSAAFLAHLSAKKADESVVLDTKSFGGVAKRIEVLLLAMPRLIGLYDDTLLVNKLVLDFRAALREAKTTEVQTAARLNLAVALMKIGNWDEAKSELDKVTLPDRSGVSNGTVQYLLGVCLDGLGRPSEADAAFKSAVTSKTALLTGDGPPIRELAEAKLADLQRRRR